jgi:predicted branched-subunit amino acid permease
VTATRGADPVARPGPPVRTAIRDTVPLALPIAPFAFAIGSSMAAAGIPLVAGWGGGAMLLAGTAQLSAIEVLGGGGGLWTAVGIATLVNLRFVLYSAGLRVWFAQGPRWRTLLFATALVDQTFLLCERRFSTNDDPEWRWRYYATVSVVLVTVFIGIQPVGYLVGNATPAGVGLEMAAPLVFAGMLASSLRRRVDLVAGVAAGMTVVVASPLPGGLALPVAAVLGLTVGSSLEARR